tara:strand:- start:3288 stop:4487 length:1200 start_codon:yes stop_codon:yes gene_type:complete
LKAAESYNSLSKAASSDSLGSLSDDPNDQTNDPSYKGPKDPIQVGPKGKLFLDHYDVMGLGRERFKATVEQVQANFKIRSLMLHPDKCGIAQVSVSQSPHSASLIAHTRLTLSFITQASEEDKEKLEARFKNLGEAFEVLTDAKRRREYDSVDAPTTKLPTLKEDGSNFFKKAIPALKELAKFFDGKGDAFAFINEDPAAPYAEVRKMYEFWAKFKSWREFPHEEEDDAESKDDRWQRREAEKKNKKLREDEKKMDVKRTKVFLGSAEDCDPRVILARKEEQDAKDAKKLAKGAGKREAEAAAAAAAELAEEKAKLDKVGAKKELEKQKKALRKEKARLRENAARGAGDGSYPGEDKVEDLCGALEFDGMKALNDALDGIKDAGGVAAAVNKALAEAGK